MQEIEKTRFILQNLSKLGFHNWEVEYLIKTTDSDTLVRWIKDIINEE